jgi:hypothetical protein
MAEAGLSERGLKGIWRDYRWMSSILGVVFSASALISLVQHWGDVRLEWGFAHFVSFYRAAIHPIIDLVLVAPVNALIAWLHLDWSIPTWMKDMWALAALCSGLLVRAESARSAPERSSPDPELEALVKEVLKPFWLQAWLEQAAAWTKAIVMAVLGALTGLSVLVLVLNVFWRPSMRAMPLEPGHSSRAQTLRYQVAKRILSDNRRLATRRLVWITGAATAVFYIGNALAPQLQP